MNDSKTPFCKGGTLKELRRNMKNGLVVVALMICCASSKCTTHHSVAVAGPKGESVDAELSIYELVLRSQIAQEPKGEAVFVSFGESWVDHVDPPTGFLGRLAGLDVSLEPVSRHGEHDDPDAVLLVVHLSQWTSETRASVSVRFRFGVGVSEGFTAVVEWADGLWRLAKTMDYWGT